MNFKVTAKDKEEGDYQIAVELVVSPSDLPYYATLEEEGLHKIRVVLGYLNEEKKKIKLPIDEDHCMIELGDNTGRIYSIIVDSNHLQKMSITNKEFKKKINWSNREERFKKNFRTGGKIIQKSFSKFRKMKEEELLNED